MSNIEKIRQEIERLKKILEESTYYLDNSQQALGYSFALDDFKELIDSLPEEKPSEELEEAANEFANQDCVTFISRKKGFIAGAEWMRKKDVEDMYMSDNRHFLKCYEQGKVDMKEQMMKDAVEAEITVGRLPDDWSLAYNPDELHRALLKFKSGDKVKIIIVKQ